MPRRVWTFLLCAGLLFSVHSRADDSKDLAALLDRADLTARGFQGEFEIFQGQHHTDAPLDFGTDGLRREFRGRLWVEGDDALVEFLGVPGMAPPGWNGRYKDIVQVLAASKNATFDFTAVDSTVTPYANLRVYPPDQPEWVRNRINSQILDYLNAISTINGFPVESLLASGDGVVRADPAKGQYSVTARYNDAKNPSTIIYDLAITDQTVRCSSKITAGPPTSVITIETLVEGDIHSGALIPRRVAKRISGPKLGAAKREVAHFTPKDLAPAPFPITAPFFQKYERAYAVLQGAAQTGEFINAPLSKASLDLHLDPNPAAPPPASRRQTRLAVLALGVFLAATIAASGLVLWLRSRKGRSTSKKPEGPFRELL